MSGNCIDFKIFTRNESDGSGKTTLEKGGRNPPGVSLLHIFMDLLSFLSQFVSLNRVKNQIEEKYDIKKEPGYCWPADDIKRAWGKTQRLAEYSSRRRLWGLVILLQIIKRRLYYEECKRKEAQSDPMKGNSAQSCPGLCLSDYFDQMETGKWNACWEAKGDHWLSDDQACGTEQSITGDREDGSTPCNSGLVMTRPQGSHKKKKSAAPTKQEKVAAKDSHAYERKQKESVSSLPQCQPSDSKESDMCKSQKKFTIYIRIPFLYMSGKMSSDEVPNVNSSYKFIAELPSGSSDDVRKRKSYVMSYDKQTKNAQWVYEILNKMTLQKNCKMDMSLGKNEFKNKLYDQGHLAAAANHKWCQEAYHDTFLLSNMTPQLSLLNKGMWSTLEQYCRDLVKDDSVRNVHVYTGPLYLNKEKESKKYVRVPNPKNEKDFGEKALPTHFFKVVIVEKEDGNILEPKCYQMPNKKREYEKQLKENEEEEEEAAEEEEAEVEKAEKEAEEKAEKQEKQKEAEKEEKEIEAEEKEKAEKQKEEKEAEEKEKAEKDEKQKAEKEKEAEEEKEKAEKDEKQKAEKEAEEKAEKQEKQKEAEKEEKEIEAEEKEKEKAEKQKEEKEAEEKEKAEKDEKQKAEKEKEAEEEKEKAEEKEKEKEEKAEKANPDKELLKFLTNIYNIENLSGLEFSYRRNDNKTVKKNSVELEGEKRNGDLLSVHIEVRITPVKK